MFCLRFVSQQTHQVTKTTALIDIATDFNENSCFCNMTTAKKKQTNKLKPSPSVLLANVYNDDYAEERKQRNVTPL